MKFFVLIVAVALTLLAFQPNQASAVGYERYDVSNGHAAKAGIPHQTDAPKKPAFWEKYPVVLDDVAFFVRDVLSQFGLAEHRSR